MRAINTKYYAFLSLMIMFFSQLGYASPTVLVTLKPIHSLICSIMEGVGEPQLIIPDGASPHDFHLKPSGLKQLQQADLIIWVDPTLEAFLQKPLSQFNPRLGVILLSTIPHLKKLPLRHSREWEHAEDDHDHDHGEDDPHLWLSTDNAKVIASYIAEYLAKVDPENKNIYTKNKTKLLKKLDNLKTTLSNTLAPIQKQPFLVYHDGYQYFENEFHLQGAGTMVLNPHVPLSAHSLQAIKSLINQKQIKCVFRETEFKDNQIRNFLSGLNVKVDELDPLGYRYPKGPDNYEQMMLGLGNTLKDCLH